MVQCQVISRYGALNIFLLFTLGLSLSFLFPNLSYGQKRQLRTSAVAQVGPHVVTLREVKMNVLLDEALYGAPTTRQDLPAQIQGVIVEWAVYLEAQSFAFSTVSRGEIASKTQVATDALGDNQEWAAWDPTPEEMVDMVRRKLIAKSFLDFKASSSRVPVSDEEALAYFQKNQSKFGSLPFNSFKESIVNYLVQNQLEARLREWLDLLRTKYDVRMFTVGTEEKLSFSGGKEE